VASKLIVVVVVEALYGRVLDGAVHSLDLTVGPRVLRLRGAMIDPGLRAGELEGVGPEEFSLRQSFLDLRDRRASRPWRRELDAVVGQHGVDLVGHGFEETAEEVGRDPRRGFLVQLDEGELRGAVDGDEQVELALLGPDLGDVDMEVADRVALELALVGLVAVDLRQPADPMTLKAAMQG
jgi:hypothetical protein